MVAEHEAPHVGDMGEARNRIMIAFQFETFLWTAGKFFFSRENKSKDLWYASCQSQNFAATLPNSLKWAVFLHAKAAKLYNVKFAKMPIFCKSSPISLSYYGIHVFVAKEIAETTYCAIEHHLQTMSFVTIVCQNSALVLAFCYQPFGMLLRHNVV